MDVPDLVEVVALGQGGSGYDAALGVARDGAQVLDVGGEEQPSVVDPKRVRRVREEAELHPRAHLMLVAGKRGVVVVEPHAGPQLPFVRGRDGGLRVYADVTAPESRVRRRPGAARGSDRREVFVPPGQRRQHAGLELEPVICSAERPLRDELSAKRWRQPRFTNPFTSC